MFNSKKVLIEVVKLSNFYAMPFYATSQSAGMDLFSAIEETIVINPQCVTLIKTGIAIALPEGYEAQIRPRSGLALKFSITVINSPGTIGSDYRGEIMVALINLGKEPFKVERGQRIAQMVIGQFSRSEWDEVTEFREQTDRGDGGFGSTGN